jgi:peptidoglycan/LPS O-acetylase OafA/YrhL
MVEGDGVISSRMGLRHAHGVPAGEIRALTSLRGLAAVYVVAYHASDAAGVNLAPHGYLAVDLFFVLSGFVLALTAAGDFAALGWRAAGGFLARRVARIMPLNLAVVAAIVTANIVAHGGAGAPLGRVACNALALQGWGTCVTLNAPAWTLSFEWLAYLVFPVVLWLVLFSPRAVCAAMVVIAWGGLVALALHTGRGSFDSSQFGAGWSAVRCVAEMVLGVAAYRAYAAAAIRQLLGSDAAVLVLCGLGAAACCWGEGAKSFVLGGDVWVALAFPLLIAAVSANAGAVRRWLAAPPLHWLGVISFSIYLVHDALLQRAARLADHAGADWRGGVWFVVAATACVVPVAWATFVWVERPGRAFVRRLVFGTPATT